MAHKFIPTVLVTCAVMAPGTGFSATYTDIYSVADHFYFPAVVRQSFDDGSVTEEALTDQGRLGLLEEAPGFDETKGTLTRVDMIIDYVIPSRVTSFILGFDESDGGVVSTIVRITADLSVRGFPETRFIPGRFLIDDQPLGFVEETAVCDGEPGENCRQQNNFELLIGSPISLSFTDPDDLFYFSGRYDYSIGLFAEFIDTSSTETSRWGHLGGTVPRDGTFSLDPPSVSLKTTFHYEPTPIPLPASGLLLAGGVVASLSLRRFAKGAKGRRCSDRNVCFR